MIRGSITREEVVKVEAYPNYKHARLSIPVGNIFVVDEFEEGDEVRVFIKVVKNGKIVRYKDNNDG